MTDMNRLKKLAGLNESLNEGWGNPKAVVHVELYSGHSEVVNLGDWPEIEAEQLGDYEEVQGNGSLVYKSEDDMFVVYY